VKTWIPDENIPHIYSGLILTDHHIFDPAKMNPDAKIDY
jgi:hypothetical protein